MKSLIGKGLFIILVVSVIIVPKLYSERITRVDHPDEIYQIVKENEEVLRQDCQNMTFEASSEIKGIKSIFKGPYIKEKNYVYFYCYSGGGFFSKNYYFKEGFIYLPSDDITDSPDYQAFYGKENYTLTIDGNTYRLEEDEQVGQHLTVISKICDNFYYFGIKI